MITSFSLLHNYLCCVFLVLVCFCHLSTANSLCNLLDLKSMIIPEISSLVEDLSLIDARNTVVGDQTRWWRLLHRLDEMEAENDISKNSINLAVFGGSMVLGFNCNDGRNVSVGCAYPRRFTNWLQTQYPHVSFILNNMGKSGSPTGGTLPELPILLLGDRPLDIVMIDFTVNDAQRLRSDCKKDSDKCSTKGFNPLVLSATEHFLEELLLELPCASLILMVDADPLDFSIPSHNSHLLAASNYNVSVIDYHSLIRSNLKYLQSSNSVMTVFERYWSESDDRHPPWQIHHLIAYVMAYSWQLERSRACELIQELKHVVIGNPIQSVLHSWVPYHKGHMPIHSSQNKYWDVYGACSQPLSFYSARTHSNSSNYYHGIRNDSGVRVTSGNWTLYEDRPGKPGWISTGPMGSSIEFDVKFGQNPGLVIGYLRSYEGLGSAIVTYSTKIIKPIVLNAIDVSNHASQTFTQNMPRLENDRWINSSLTIRVTLNCKCKFKLEFVVSC